MTHITFQVQSLWMTRMLHTYVTAPQYEWCMSHAHVQSNHSYHISSIHTHTHIQPIADRVAQHLEIISKNFQFSTRRTRILMGFISYYLVLIVNPMGRILVRWKSCRNNLKMLCHPICNWLYISSRVTMNDAHVTHICHSTSIWMMHVTHICTVKWFMSHAYAQSWCTSTGSVWVIHVTYRKYIHTCTHTHV